MRPSFPKEHFLNLWRAIFPRSYTQPIEDENDGESFDVPSAQAAIMEHASEAFEISQQAYFLKPHSIQTKPESSKEANIPFYERHGFRVDAGFSPPGGPRLWAMTRLPA